MGIMKKTLAFILACTMMLCYCFSATALAEDQIKAKFELVKVSETPDEVVLNVNLVKGSFISFDIEVATGSNLECKTIARSNEFKLWDVDDDSYPVTNKDTGKVSVICTRLCEFDTETTLFTYKYTKLVKDGVKASDFTVSVSEFYTKVDGSDLDITEFTVFDNTLPATHTHIAGGDFVTTEASTCTKQGTQVKYCTECAGIAESESLPKASHVRATKTEDATCEKSGEILTYCSVCNEELGRAEIQAKGHTEVPMHQDATCENDGYDKTVCSVCEKELSSKILPATGHLHQSVVTENPTCTKSGSKKTVCLDCEKVLKTDPIYPTGHVNTKVVTEAPICGHNGYSDTVCADCGEVISHIEIPAISDKHGTTTNQHKDATCEEDGYDKEICDICGAVVSEVTIPATGHTEKTTTVNPTCEEAGSKVTVCTVCHKELNREILEATGHTEATKTIAPKCEEAGCIITYCTVCEKELKKDVIEPTGHLSTHPDNLAAKCEDAGYERMVCDTCGKVVSENILPPTGHLHTNEKITDPTCTVDGKIDVICLDCEKVIDTTTLTATGHHYVAVNKDATCEEDGYIGMECPSCGDRDVSVITKFGHKWSAWKTVTNATYAEEGLKERTCSTCHKVEQKTIPIIPVKPTSIVILPENDITLKLGKSTQLYGNLIPANAAYSNTITWSSSNEKVLTVDENGVVTAVGFGTATITASSDGGNVTAEKTIKVEFSLWQWLVKLILGWITGKK